MKSKMKKKMIVFLLCMVLVICNSVSILADTPAEATTTTAVEKQTKESKAAKSDNTSGENKTAGDNSADDNKDTSKQSEESSDKKQTTEAKTDKKEEFTKATTETKDDSDKATETTTEVDKKSENGSETSKVDEVTTEAKNGTTKTDETTPVDQSNVDKADTADGQSDKTTAGEENGKAEETTTEAKEETAAPTLTYEDENVIVTVSEVAKGAIPKNSELKVVPILKNNTETKEQYTEVENKIQEKAAETETEIKGFLAYDITFVDKDGNEIEPTSEVKVSMEYKKAAIPAELTAEDAKNTEVSVLHLEEDDAGNVSKVVDMNEAGKVDILEITDAKQVEKVEVLADSFSAYAIAWAVENIDENAIQPVTTTLNLNEAETEGSILTQDMLQYNNLETSNKWQIVDNGYVGNNTDDKIFSNDGNVKLQKNVIATDVENEFLVYLSLDVKQMFKEYFQIAEYQATTSNNYHSEDLGKVVSSMTGNQNVEVSGEPIYKNSASFDILDDKGNYLVKDITLYWNQANNITFFLKINDNTYILMGIEVGKGAKNTIKLSEEALELIREEVSKAAQIDRIEDVMGDYIEYRGIVACDGTTSYGKTNNTLTWTPALKKNPETTETGEGENITKWSHNVAELVYRVRLKVEKDGFNSCANNMESLLGDKETYAVNEKATLYYDEGKTAEFPVPHVRGLLYDIEFTKHDENGTPLSGAEFTISGTYCGENIERKAISQADGSVKIKNIPWGTYTLTETDPPEGYQDDETSIENNIILCYTQHSELLDGNHIGLHQSDAENDISRFLYNQNISNDNIIVNKKVTTSVSVHKKWNLPGDNYGHPDEVTVELLAKVDGADFELPDNIATEVVLNDENNWTYTFNNLPMKNADGDKIIYTVIETKIGLFPVEDSSYESKVTGNQEDGFIITNTWIEFWYLYKVSDTDETIGLPGAQFTLTETDTGKVYYGKSYQNGFVAWFESKEDADKDIVEKILRYIPNGEYVLEETEAPQGYQKSDIQWTITIENLQLISIVDSKGQTVDTYNPSSRAAIKEYHFVNEPLYALPATGGPGIYWYTFGGTLLMAGAALIVYRQKRKWEVLLRK